MSDIKARILHTHDTEANWNLCAKFIPKQGEIIVYDIDENISYSRIKVGDGITSVVDLPFANEGLLGEAILWDGDIGYVDAGRVTSYK